MQDNRYYKYMNWDYNNLNKGDKCNHYKCCCEFEKCEHKQEKCKHKHDKCECKHDKCWHKHDECERKHDNSWHKDDECERKHDKCDCKKKQEDDKHKCKKEKCDDKFEHKCKGCICDLLRCLEPGTLVDVLLSGGGSFLGVLFIRLDPKTCCAYFLEVGDAAAATPVVIDCQKIDGIRRNPVA
ncbi:hypothetical protein ABIA69_004636 [Lysinibacillus parviboronicapiens]|uniref:Uncharacterized protein n=1 Tax=Lysinibacillus parviboronicapiens TaxID=436516 RepID=A0ABV2PRM2_9BACI